MGVFYCCLAEHYQEYGLHAELPQYFASSAELAKRSAAPGGSLAAPRPSIPTNVSSVYLVLPQTLAFSTHRTFHFMWFQQIRMRLTSAVRNHYNHSSRSLCFELLPYVQTFCPQVHFVSPSNGGLQAVRRTCTTWCLVAWNQSHSHPLIKNNCISAESAPAFSSA